MKSFRSMRNWNVIRDLKKIFFFYIRKTRTSVASENLKMKIFMIFKNILEKKATDKKWQQS
jgi:hypothetical protein